MPSDTWRPGVGQRGKGGDLSIVNSPVPGMLASVPDARVRALEWRKGDVVVMPSGVGRSEIVCRCVEVLSLPDRQVAVLQELDSRRVYTALVGDGGVGLGTVEPTSFHSPQVAIQLIESRYGERSAPIRRAEKVEQSSFSIEEIVEAWKNALVAVPGSQLAARRLAEARRVLKALRSRARCFPGECGSCQFSRRNNNVCFYCVGQPLEGDIRQREGGAVGTYIPCERGCEPNSLSRAIMMYKKGHRELARPLGLLLAGYISRKKESFEGIDTVVAAPVNSDTLARDGGNRNELLARVLGKRLRLRVYEDAFEYTRRVLPQHKLDRQRRFENVRGAFRVRQPSRFSSRSVLIIDDITTTGATLEELKRTMETEANPCRVRTLAIAKTKMLWIV